MWGRRHARKTRHAEKLQNPQERLSEHNNTFAYQSVLMNEWVDAHVSSTHVSSTSIDPYNRHRHHRLPSRIYSTRWENFFSSEFFLLYICDWLKYTKKKTEGVGRRRSRRDELKKEYPALMSERESEGADNSIFLNFQKKTL